MGAGAPAVIIPRDFIDLSYEAMQLEDSTFFHSGRTRHYITCRQKFHLTLQESAHPTILLTTGFAILHDGSVVSGPVHFFL